MGMLVKVRRRVDPREIDLESRTGPGLAVHRDVAARLLNDPIYRSKPKPGAFAWFLCCKEGFEEVRYGLLIHSGAGVAHRQRDIRAWLYSERGVRAQINVARLDRQRFSSPRHRVASIDREIHDYLFDLTGVSLDGAEIRGQQRSQLNVLSDQASQQAFNS